MVCQIMRDVLTHPVFNFVAGSGITWFFAWFYYKRAGDELRAEAQALHTATGAILYYLEHPDAKIQVQRDDKGRVSGLIVSASGQATVTFSARGTLSDASGS
jgi:hypothetical protein